MTVEGRRVSAGLFYRVSYCSISFKQHLNIVNGGAGPLPWMCWVGLGWYMRIGKSV